MTTTTFKTVPRRTMKCGAPVRARFTRTEANMLALEEQTFSTEYEDAGRWVYVAGVVLFGEAFHDLVHVAVGGLVLRMPWARLHQP